MNRNSCLGCRGCAHARPSRRQFVGALAAAALPAPRASAQKPERQQPVELPLKVQPVLVYDIYKRREATSWRPWGGLHTEQDVAREKERIAGELKQLSSTPGFPLQVRSLATAQTPEQAARLAAADHDVTLMYAATGSQKTLETLTTANRWNLMFVRHRSGPVSLWYEIADPRFLRKGLDERTQAGMDVHDVVVDSHAEVLWRLRGLYGLKNTLGKKIVAVGGPSGWSAGGRQAPDRARELWKLDIQTVPYSELGERIQRARRDAALVRRTTQAADNYLRRKGVRLETKREFVTNAFLLTEIFHDLLDEARTDAITINNCMSTIMPMSETTACMPLSLLNDAGYLAFCESDFVVIPSGILLRYISGKPVFLNDPTHPHDGVVTLAHCTAPRKMDGANLEPVRILTHFESDYGAAPKVEMRKGAKMTVLDPDFASRKWLGFDAEVVDNPFLDICRSQIDVAIRGSTRRLVEQMRGFHWMASYGSYLKESGYALGKLGVEFNNISG